VAEEQTGIGALRFGRTMRSVGAVSIGAVCLLGLLADAQGAQVVVFGDSWATGARTAFTDMFDNHGANVT